MTILQWVNTAVVVIGLPTIIGVALNIGGKLHLLESLEESTKKMKHNLKVMSDYLIRHHGKFDPTQLQSFSPLSLTETGTKFIKDIGFDNVFSSNKREFFELVDNDNPKLKYDVELAAIKSVYLLYDKEYMNFLKVLFYNDPKRTLENTAPTLGIYVRDAYLKEHPEITQ